MRRRAFLASGLAALALPRADLAAAANPPLDTAAFDAWEADFMARARRGGVSSELLEREFKGLTLDPRVVALDGQQPEFSRPISDYIRSAASDERVAVGRSRRAAAHWLEGIEQRFGTPSEILVSIWAVESGFGATLGDFDVLRSLATLAAAGRRRDWAEGQILALFRIMA